MTFTRFCGGKNKESVYQMHDCNAAAYVPTDPNEAMNLATELTKNGVKFYVKDREIGVRSRAFFFPPHRAQCPYSMGKTNFVRTYK